MDYSKLNGLIPAVIQDADSSEVLMVGFMNEEALAETRRTGYRDVLQPHAQQALDQRRDLGQSPRGAGHLVDCDDDTVLLKVKRLGDGNVCHTGERTCFFRSLEPGAAASGE